MNIIPGILARTKKEFNEQFKRVKWVPKVHIDVTDGKFVNKKSVYFLKKNAQVHLMVRNPLKYIEKCSCKEVIIHAESNNVEDAVLLTKRKGLHAGIAFSPKTRVQKELIRLADFALVMTVTPGASGQVMRKSLLKKITQIKAIKNISVGVDGGVNKRTILMCKKAGADFVIATSAVTLMPDSKRAYKELKKII